MNYKYSLHKGSECGYWARSCREVLLSVRFKVTVAQHCINLRLRRDGPFTGKLWGTLSLALPGRNSERTTTIDGLQGWSSDSWNLTLGSSTFWMDSCREYNKISFICVLFSKLEKHGKNGCQLLIV